MGKKLGGRTALHHASAAGDLNDVRRLLGAGEDVNAPDNAGWTPLHFAAQSQALPVVEELIEAGADVDAVDEHGNGPLFRAVFDSRGQPAVVRALRDAGADPWRTNKHGQSAVGLARLIDNYPTRRLFDDLPDQQP